MPGRMGAQVRAPSVAAARRSPKIRRIGCGAAPGAGAVVSVPNAPPHSVVASGAVVRVVGLRPSCAGQTMALKCRCPWVVMRLPPWEVRGVAGHVAADDADVGGGDRG